MRSGIVLLALIAGFTLLLAPSIYGTEEAPPPMAPSIGTGSWICERAFSEAAAMATPGAPPGLIDAAVRSCASAGDWLLVARSHPEAIGGVDPRGLLEARCGDPAAGLSAYAACHGVRGRKVKLRPGTITVRSSAVSRQIRLDAGVGVEIVLDTSGSMSRKVKGVRRIDIAKDSLAILIGDALAEGTSVALRTFGGGGGGASDCQTDLVLPVAPLDREATLELVGKLGAQRKTGSPIAASLAAVADDLAVVTGRRTVVLITDGDETCGGDPLAEIARLQTEGPELSLNVVGFALTNAQTRARMASWAEAGGGAYFDASSAGELASAINSAIASNDVRSGETLFRVISMEGTTMGQGTVGGAPVRVQPGTYRVEIMLDPPVLIDDVVVGDGKSVRLEVPRPA